MYMHILISTDGSEVAQKGVDHGLSLAKRLGARVTIITVTERLSGFAGIGEWIPTPQEIAGYEAGQKKEADKILAGAKALADRMGVEAETLHIPGPVPADAIIETAQAKHCSLIAMASHGRRGLGRLLLGSQTAEVLARSPVPVLVVR